MKKIILLPLVLVFLGLPGVFGAHAEELPICSIRTEAGAAIDSKEDYLYCTVSIDGLREAPAQIKGRGNSTWGNEGKKPYRLKFVQKQNPFSVGHQRERDWVLLADYYDKSLLRNYTALLLASRLDGIDVTVGCQSVQLYLNGEYEGVYLLCERIEDNSCGLVVDAENGGFLLEIDIYATGEGSFLVFDKTYAVHSAYQTQAQVDEIQYFIDELDTAINMEDEELIREYMDIDSWIDAYLLEELTMNCDAGYSSFYLYRRDADEKLFAGPMWDFDLTMGNNRTVMDGSYEELYVCEFNGTDGDHPWFIWLMDTEWFAKAVYDRWLEVAPIVDEVILQVAEVAERYGADFERNFERWPVLNTRVYKEPEALLELGSHRENADYLLDWLRARKDWLSAAFAERVAEYDED